MNLAIVVGDREAALASVVADERDAHRGRVGRAGVAAGPGCGDGRTGRGGAAGRRLVGVVRRLGEGLLCPRSNDVVVGVGRRRCSRHLQPVSQAVSP